MTDAFKAAGFALDVIAEPQPDPAAESLSYSPVNRSIATRSSPFLQTLGGSSYFEVVGGVAASVSFSPPAVSFSPPARLGSR